MAIGVPSGLSEIVRTGFGSGKSEVIPFGGPAGAGATSGVLMVAASAVASVGPAGAGGLAEGALLTDACAFKSTGCSSELTTLTALGLPLSWSREAPASLDVETVWSLGGATFVGP